MYTQHFSHAPKIDQAPFMTQAMISNQNGLGGYKKKDQELQQHLNQARDQDSQFIEGKLQDTENQFHTGWGSQQLPISVRMDRIRQGLSKVPKGHVHARLYRNKGVYSTNGQYIMEQGFGNNVNSLLQVMAMTGAQLKLEHEKSEKQKMKHKLIQEQLDKPAEQFDISTVKNLDSLMNSQLLEVFDSSLVHVRMDPRHFQAGLTDPSAASSLLTSEQRKKFITFALDPAKSKDRRDFLTKAEQIHRQIHDSNTNAEALKIKSEYQHLIQETFDVQAPLSQGLSGISDIISKQMDAIQQLSKPDNFTTTKFQSDYYLADRHNSINSQEMYAKINGQAAINRSQMQVYDNSVNNELQFQNQEMEEVSSFAPTTTPTPQTPQPEQIDTTTKEGGDTPQQVQEQQTQM